MVVLTLRLTTAFSFKSGLNTAMEAMEERLFGRNDLSDLTPLQSPKRSRPGSPQPDTPSLLPSLNAIPSTPPTPPFFDASSVPETPKKRRATASPETSPARVKGAAKKKRRRENRQNKRERERTNPTLEGDQYGYTKHVVPSIPLKAEKNFREAKAASSGYIGLDDKIREEEDVRLVDALSGNNHSKRKLALQEWDGRLPIPITDTEGRAFAVLAGMADSTVWPALMRDAAEALEQARKDSDLKPEDFSHRRGNYPCLRTGVSMGGGQTSPMAAANSDVNNRVLDRLNGMECFKRLASFTTSVLKTWAPGMHARYASNIAELKGHHKALKFPFQASVFPSVTYNLGPRTVTFPHVDFLNLAYGWCAITALGSYDYKKGGHLILWDLGLVIEFPPGATILIPSAVLSHSNVAILAGESRYSVTQYAAGGLFRWVDNGFKGNRSLSRKEDKRRKRENFTRWADALSVFRVLP